MASKRSPLVRQVIGIYQKWHGVAVCSAEDWADKVGMLQRKINDCEITLPIPRIDLNETRVKFDIPEGNPLNIEPVYKEKVVKSRHSRYAGKVAQMLRDAGHAVFYVNHSLAVSGQYSGGDLMVRDILTSAPVVVYLENRDGRKNGWVKDLLLTRQYGIAIVVIQGGN